MQMLAQKISGNKMCYTNRASSFLIYLKSKMLSSYFAVLLGQLSRRRHRGRKQIGSDALRRPSDSVFGAVTEISLKIAYRVLASRLYLPLPCTHRDSRLHSNRFSLSLRS